MGTRISLTEVMRIHPDFDPTEFGEQLEEEIVPTLFQAVDKSNTVFLHKICGRKAFAVLNDTFIRPRKFWISRGIEDKSYSIYVGDSFFEGAELVEHKPQISYRIEEQRVHHLVEKSTGETYEGKEDMILSITWRISLKLDTRNSKWIISEVVPLRRTESFV